MPASNDAPAPKTIILWYVFPDDVGNGGASDAFVIFLACPYTPPGFIGKHQIGFSQAAGPGAMRMRSNGATAEQAESWVV